MSKKLEVPNAWVVPPERKSESREEESQSPSTAEKKLSAVRTPADKSDSGPAVRPGRRAKVRTEPEMAFNFKLPVSLARLVHEEALRRKTRKEANATIVGVFADLVWHHLSEKGLENSRDLGIRDDYPKRS